MGVSEHQQKTFKEQRAAQNVVLKKYDLTAVQADVLRKAARKYADFIGRDKRLHDGTVDTYNVRADTLAALRHAGYIADGFVIQDPEERKVLEEDARCTAVSAFQVVHGAADPMADFIGIYPSLLAVKPCPNWKVVYSLLRETKAVMDSLAQVGIRITDAGRAVAVEWKAALGAQEE